MLQRFWFKFRNVPPFSNLWLGCGVTGYDYADALQMLARTVFAEHPQVEVDAVIEDVDIRTLDAGHVLPNMGVPAARGIWFPLGYQLQ